MEAILYLADGTHFVGKALGASGTVVGEVVVQTTMSGLREILTDPTYCDQLVLMTYPLAANGGIPSVKKLRQTRPCGL